MNWTLRTKSDALLRAVRARRLRRGGVVEGLPSPRPAPRSVLEEAAQNVIFTAWNPLAALAAPKHYKVAVSADKAYRAAVEDAIPKLFAAGFRNVYAWGDCNYTPAEEVKALAGEHLLMWIGQGETPEEFENAMGAGAELLVGNPNAWTDSQRELAREEIGGGQLALLCECYVSESNHPFPDSYGTQGVPVASWVLGVYESTHGYVSVRDYLARTPAEYKPHVGIYLAEGVRPEDWQNLP